MPENHFYVYEHWRPDKGVCFYVGKGKGRRAWIKRRGNNHYCAVVQKLARLGLSVEIKIIQSGLTETEAFDIEKARITFWGRDALTNKTAGGDGVSNPSEDARQKISKALMGNKHSLGVIRSAEERAAISQRLRGRKQEFLVARNKSEEHRQKVSASLKGRPGHLKSDEEKAKIGAFWRGRKKSPETIAKMAAGIKLAWERKPLIASKAVICLDDGRLFPSVKEASEHYGVNKGTIYQLCVGDPRRKTAGGRVFKYSDAT